MKSSSESGWYQPLENRSWCPDAQEAFVCSFIHALTYPAVGLARCDGGRLANSDGSKHGDGPWPGRNSEGTWDEGMGRAFQDRRGEEEPGMPPGTKFELPLPLDFGVWGISKKCLPDLVSATFAFSPLMILER